MKISLAPHPTGKEIAAYLSNHLEGVGILGWTVSVTKEEESATQNPDGTSAPSLGDTASPSNEQNFITRDLPNVD